MAVHIPIFLSKPSKLNAQQEHILRYVNQTLDQENLMPRTLGQSDFPQSNPIAEAAHLARACYGGLILGFVQIETPPGIYKNARTAAKKDPASKDAYRSAATDQKSTGSEPLVFPTPWNHIEAGMLVAFRKPLLVFAEQGITGGIFDKGAFAGFMQEFKAGPLNKREREVIRERVRLWSADVRSAFRG